MKTFHTNFYAKQYLKTKNDSNIHYLTIVNFVNYFSQNIPTRISENISKKNVEQYIKKEFIDKYSQSYTIIRVNILNDFFEFIEKKTATLTPRISIKKINFDLEIKPKPKSKISKKESENFDEWKDLIYYFYTNFQTPQGLINTLFTKSKNIKKEIYDLSPESIKIKYDNNKVDQISSIRSIIGKKFTKIAKEKIKFKYKNNLTLQLEKQIIRPKVSKYIVKQIELQSPNQNTITKKQQQDSNETEIKKYIKTIKLKMEEITQYISEIEHLSQINKSKTQSELESYGINLSQKTIDNFIATITQQ